jgi:hypothetical protein
MKRAKHSERKEEKIKDSENRGERKGFREQRR